MRKYIVLSTLAFFLAISSLISATNIPAGDVYGHWTQADSPFNILGNITVPEDSVLLIDPGVIIEFQGHYQLHVNGRILAIGTQLNPILINALTDWWGIRFDGISLTQDSSCFVYCNVEDGNATGTNNFNKGGAFFINNFSKIRIDQCTISNNEAQAGGAVYVKSANPLICNNNINNNTATSYYGGGIYCDNASPTIINNIFTANGEHIECHYSSSPLISGNSLLSTSGDGIGCQGSSTPLIINNIISNTILGIVLVGSPATIVGNVITHNSGNDYGTGIFTYGGGSPTIINNTIAYNSANVYGGGICINGNNAPILRNNIIWGNTAPNGQQICLQSSANPSFYNCDIQGGAADIYFSDAPLNFNGTYTNCIDTIPDFNNIVTNDFTLQSSSACINAGDSAGLNLPALDLAGNLRICDDTIDIGAYELCGNTGLAEFSQTKNSISVYPNPGSGTFNIDNSSQDIISIGVYNMSGRIIYIINGIKGQNKNSIDLSELKSGLYILEVICDNQSYKLKLVIE